MPGVTGVAVGAAAQRVARAFIAEAARFNGLDAAGGDGDMGVTLETIGRAVIEDTSPFPDDVGAALLRLVKVISRTSGSSLSAVMMTGLLAMAQKCRDRRELGWAELPPLIGVAVEAMQARSRAALGDKTVIDGVAAIASATAGLDDGAAFAPAAKAAAAAVLDEFRDRPAMIGRLRLEPGKGVGHDDPGMVALLEATRAMAG